MSKELSEYPKELIEGRNAVEASFIFCLWKQPDLYSDYSSINENNDETIKTEDGIFYYSLGKQLYKQGFKAFDNVSVYTFLEDKPTVKKHFDKLGGYKTVEELRSLVDVENIDAYFDQIAKSNTLMMLHDKGFPVLPNIKKFARMTNQEVYDYYDYLLNSISLNTGHDAAIEDLVIDQAYPDADIYDLPLYGNQFIPLGINTTLKERIRIQAMFDGFCNGGSILHANIDTPFDSYEKAKKMTCYIADAGVTYFAFNTKIQACEDNHAFYGTICPECGKPVATEYTRVVGFYTPISTWTNARKNEYSMRKWESINEIAGD